MAKCLPAFKRGKMPILHVDLIVNTMPKGARVVVDNVTRYRGRSLTQAKRVYQRYCAKMKAQMERWSGANDSLSRRR
jgi:hypothetical protein